MSEKKNEWLYRLREDIPKFLIRLNGKSRKGFYRYSLTGDYFDDKIKWGLGNSVFFLKIMYTISLEKQYQNEIYDAIDFVKSFQKNNGYFYDPLIWILSTPIRIKRSIFSRDLSNIFNKKTMLAETRQAISSLTLYKENPNYKFLDFPKTKEDIEKYLSSLNWNTPWSAGANFSHLIFILKSSNISNRKNLIQDAINWVCNIQNETDGFWYIGNTSLQQKINGAMKIITGLKVANKVRFNYPEKIIDNLLLSIQDEQACDNFNVVYTLKYCNEILNGDYRYDEISNFMNNRLNIYKRYYHFKEKGFSFYENRTNRFYYDALISKGKNEPDIHGTVMFLWGISIIAQTLNINNELHFKEFIT